LWPWLCPRPRWGSSQRSPNPINIWISGKRGGKDKDEGIEEEKEGEGREWERRSVHRQLIFGCAAPDDLLR